MRQRKGLGFVSLFLAATAPLLGMPASAATAEEVQPIAEVRITPGGVDWLPLGEDQGFSLTVAGSQGVVVYREFAAGEVPSLGLVDQEGRALPDGTYGYELRPVPAPGEHEALPVKPPLLLSGYLEVRGGSFVDPVARPEPPSQGRQAPGGESDGTVDVADLVISEPLVVQGSACIGQDCTEADLPSAFRGLRLKSSIPDLIFEDTTVSPANRDWAIFINDIATASEYFQIADLQGGLPFTLSGGAPSHSLFVSSGGNIGLGTSTPDARLHLFSASTADVFASAGLSPTSGPAFNFGYGGASFGRGAGFLNARPDASAVAPNPSLRFLTANLERMIVTNIGRVGIGTSAPAAPLDVKQAASGLTMQLEAAGDLFFRQRNSTSGQFVDVNLIGDEFRINFGTGGVGPELRLTNTGNLIITGGYTPDYVFEPDYPLMPLDELAEFVAREKHLPNVPNAAEVAEEGLNVNEFPMQLLEKIEELTLYAIAQQETIDELRARLEAIERRDAVSSEP